MINDTNLNETQLNELTIILDGRNQKFPFETLGISLESTEREIIAAVSSIVMEEHGVNINDENGETAYTVRKAMNSGEIYVYPKTVMG